MGKFDKALRKKVTKISPIVSNKIMYRIKMHKKLELKTPTTFNEKINWLKIYDYPNNQVIIECADKYLVRNYVEKKGLKKFLTNLIGVWDNANDIDFDKLPSSFVLKCNHGCGYNIICRDKKNLNVEDTKKKLNKWLHEDFGLVSGEMHYSKIDRKIICEEFLEDDIKDYKFFCFGGKPKFFYISQNIDGDFHNMQADFFNTDGTLADFERTDHKHFSEVPKMPKNLNKMLKTAEKLSEDFQFVRVDLFDINGKIYFSELTFTPCSGFMPINPEKKDEEIGDMIKLDMEDATL